MTTKFHYPIRTRLQWSLSLFIVTLSGMFALTMILLVFWFEQTLFYNHISSDLEKYIIAYQDVDERLVEPQGDTTFYKLASDEDALLPEQFQGYAEGNHEILLSDSAFNLFVRYRGPWVYVLVQDQSEFERSELIAIAGVILGVLLIWCLGHVVSGRIAAKILQPVIQLAAAVELSRGEPSAQGLIPEQYSDDEVGRLATAVERYAAQVAALLEREKQFTADVSHELRTPMMAIQGASDLLKEVIPQSPIKERLMGRIDRALLDMQNQVALYLRLARAPEQLENESLSTLAEVAESTLALWQPEYQAKGILLQDTIEQATTAQTLTSAAPIPTLLMSAVLNNLLRNALNHTDSGSVTLKVGARSISIVDTGSGIDPEIAGRIFNRGVRSAKGPDLRYGLGLSIVKRICDHQQWTLQVSQNQPTGTRVTVVLQTA